MSEQLARILKKNKTTILEVWEKSVREKLIPARKETKWALRDSVPDFIDDLILALQTSLNQVKPDILRFAHKHGSERANASDYSIEDALSEYNLLRRVIFESLEAEAQVASEERDIILEAINYGMMKAGAEYAKRQMNNLEAIIEQMPAAVWIANAPSGEIMISNSLGKNDLYYQAFHKSEHILARSIVNGSPCRDEIVKISKKDAPIQYIRLDASPVSDKQGEIIMGVAIGTDVSELYSAKEELRVLFELAGTGKAVVSSKSGKIFRVNKAFSDMMKYDEKELLRMKFSDLMDHTVKDKHKKFMRKDGSEFWGEIYSSTLPLDAEGNDQSVCTIIDVTERKRSEDLASSISARLQLITDIQPNLIAQVDKNLRYEFINRTYLEWHGLEFQDIIGKKISDILNPKEFSKIEPFLKEALKGNRVVFDRSIEFHNGQTRFVHCTYSPEVNVNGEVSGIYLSVSDHTEQRKTMEDFRKLAIEQKEVADSLFAEQKMRDKFISALSHDLRTPLTTATISSQMIEKKSKDPGLTALAKRSTASLNRVAKMIEDLLDANSFQAGNKYIPELQHMNVVELTQNTLDELETIYGERFILDSVDVIKTHLSPNGVRRVIENLCSNAIKYGSPTAPVTVALSSQGKHLLLSVHNYGVPIKAEETQALFEQFVRSSSASKSGKTGWGIGLSVVKGVVEAQGGKVDIESDEDGTTFKILLPLDARQFVDQNKEATGEDGLGQIYN